MARAVRFLHVLVIAGLSGCAAHGTAELRQGSDSKEFPAPISIVYNASVKTLQDMGLAIKDQDSRNHCVRGAGGGLFQGNKDVRVCMDSLEPSRTLVRLEYLDSSGGIAGKSNSDWSGQLFQKLWRALHISIQ